MSNKLDQIQPLETGAIEAWGEVPPIPALITDAAHNLFAEAATEKQRADMLAAELEVVKAERDALQRTLNYLDLNGINVFETVNLRAELELVKAERDAARRLLVEERTSFSYERLNWIQQKKRLRESRARLVRAFRLANSEKHMWHTFSKMGQRETKKYLDERDAAREDARALAKMANEVWNPTIDEQDLITKYLNT